MKSDPPTNDAADDAALNWVARRMSCAMTPEEEAAFDRWRNFSATNREALRAVEAAAAAADGDAAALLAAEFEEQLEARAARLRVSPPRWRAMAAAVVGLGAASLTAFFVLSGSNSETQSYATAVGESASVALADGSAIHLNTDTALTVEMKRADRVVRLARGEALFEVARDEQRPFRVRTENAAIVVAGTVFNVTALDGASAIYVLSGAVEVRPNADRAAALTSGEAISIDRSGKGAGVSAFEPELVLAWRNGRLRFRGAPLGTVVAALNRHFPTPLALSDPSLASLPVTGEFDVKDQDGAARALALIFDLEISRDSGHIVLGPAP